MYTVHLDEFDWFHWWQVGTQWSLLCLFSPGCFGLTDNATFVQAMLIWRFEAAANQGIRKYRVLWGQNIYSHRVTCSVHFVRGGNRECCYSHILCYCNILTVPTDGERSRNHWLIDTVSLRRRKRHDLLSQHGVSLRGPSHRGPSRRGLPQRGPRGFFTE